ncbi:MAG: O-antigen ligase family protein, partial [Owenweeksia sp.]
VFALVEISRAIISGDFLTNIYTVTATFGHKNLLSSVLLLSMPFALMGSVVLNGKWKKVSLVLLFLLIAEIFILRTRGVWSSFFMASAGTILVFFTMRKNQRDAIKFPGRLVAIGGGIAVILLIAFFSASGTKSSLADSSNLSKRVVFWEHSMEMVKERPLLGVGPGNWKIYFPKYGLQGTDVSVKQGITHIQRPHNDYLWVLSEGGPLAFVLYLAVFIFTLVRLGKNLKQGNGRDEKVIDLALVFGLLAYKGFSLTDFPMERISHNLLLFTMVALAFRNSLSEKKTFNGMAPKLLVLALSVFALVVAGYRWKGERNSVDVLNGNASRNAQLMMQASAKALNPFYNMDNFANPIPYYSSVGNMVTRNYGKAWEDAQYAHDLHPNNIIVLNQVGNVLKNQGKLNEALTYYNRATEISPSLEYTRLSKAEIFLNKRQYADAMGELIWIDPQSENGKFLQLLAIVLPKFVKESAVNGRFSRIAEGIRAQQPVEPAEYITAYRITRKNLSGKP